MQDQKVSYTPGPWVPVKNRWMDYEILRSEDGMVLFVENNAPTQAESDANARLIAAAPDLLEAAKLILTRLDMEPVGAVFPGSACRDMLRAAIDKAEGR